MSWRERETHARSLPRAAHNDYVNDQMALTDRLMKFAQNNSRLVVVGSAVQRPIGVVMLTQIFSVSFSARVWSE